MKRLSITSDEEAKKAGVQTYGPNEWVTLCKAWHGVEHWMKSTKAMLIPGVGSLVQVTTQQGENVAEALVFLPGVGIKQLDEGAELVRME